MVRVSLASVFNSEGFDHSELKNYQDLFNPDKLHFKDPDYFGSEEEEITLSEYPDEENNQDNSDNIEIVLDSNIPVIDEPDIEEELPEINIPEDALYINTENNQSEEIQIEPVPEENQEVTQEVTQEEIPEINPETSPGDVLKELKNESSENSNNQKDSETDSEKEPKKDSKKNQKNDSKKKNQKTDKKK